MVIMSSSSAAAQMSHPNNAAASSSGTTGGTGGQDKLPSLFIERPKMPRATWDALRSHILKERLRKKQEQEQTQEVERMKKEREHKKKQEALTIEETKEEIANTEARLAQLKEEKHQLFHTLKKVLYEDDRRRSKEMNHLNLYLQPSIRPNPSLHYMKPPPHLLMTQSMTSPAVGVSHVQQQQAMQQQLGQKRTRSPSPPRSNINSAYYRTPQHASSSNVAKYGTYATSAVASVSASAIYGHTANQGHHQQQYPYGASPSQQDTGSSNNSSKPVYLTQAEIAAVRQQQQQSISGSQQQQQQRSSYTSSLAASLAERERAVAAAAAAAQRTVMTVASAPPAAHGGVFRSTGGSIMSGYPRTVAYTVASSSPSPANSASPRLLQASPQQQGQLQPNGTVRYYQREV